MWSYRVVVLHAPALLAFLPHYCTEKLLKNEALLSFNASNVLTSV